MFTLILKPKFYYISGLKDPIKLRKKIIKSLETCSIEELEYVLKQKKQALKPKKMTEEEKRIKHYTKLVGKILKYRHNER